MKSHISILFAASAWLLITATSVNAALLERLGGLGYYDDVADLTWLADANYAQTSGFDDSGLIYWSTANLWAESLDINGITGWRLPTAAVCMGFSCSEGEMDILFHNVLGGFANSPIETVHNSNYDLFSNIQAGSFYWYGTAIPDSTMAYTYHFLQGSQGGLNSNFFSAYVWIVHSGDVATLASVPIPASVSLFVSGLIGLLGATGRKINLT